MSDIVEQSEYSLMDKLQLCNDIPICREAADRIEQLEAALREIDQARYTGRCTINPANGYDQAVALNNKLVGVMNIARAALEKRT